MTGLIRIDKCTKPVADLIANMAKGRKSFIISPFDSGRVVKAPMKTSRVAGENGTAFFGVVADGDDEVERPTDKFIDRF